MRLKQYAMACQFLLLLWALPVGFSESPTVVGSSIASGGNAAFSNIRLQGNLVAGGSVNCSLCTVGGSVTAGGSVRLQTSTIRRNMISGGSGVLQNTTVEGQIVTGGSSLQLSGSKAGEIRFEGNGAGFGRSIVITGNNKVSAINGFVIRTHGGDTTLITPENTVYVNGKKASGPGAETYSQYSLEHPQAPEVQGFEPSEKATATSRRPSKNLLVLKNNSRVDGDVIFPDEGGKVILSHDSQVLGKVINGSVETLTEQVKSQVYSN